VAEENTQVKAGTEIIRWDPGYVEESGRSAICAVVVLDCPYPAVALQPSGSEVDASQPLFFIDC
jgi:phosphotransferase system IIA component